MAIRSARAVAVLASVLLATTTLAGCRGSTDSTETDDTAAVAASEPADSLATTTAAPVDTSGDGAAVGWTASLTWPGGPSDFALNICTSQGEHTIQGGGDTSDDKYNLLFDANLLNAGDTGTLTVSDKADQYTVVYDATVTDLTVQPDGSFSGSGQDAGGQAFTITGTCEVSW